MVIRKIGQQFSVDTNAGFSERTHQSGIRRAIFAGRCIDTNDPQLAEIALADAAIAKRKLARFIDMMLGNGKNITAHPPKSLWRLGELSFFGAWPLVGF